VNDLLTALTRHMPLLVILWHIANFALSLAGVTLFEDWSVRI
jgi:hypothetical protein